MYLLETMRKKVFMTYLFWRTEKCHEKSTNFRDLKQRPFRCVAIIVFLWRVVPLIAPRAVGISIIQIVFVTQVVPVPKCSSSDLSSTLLSFFSTDPARSRLIPYFMVSSPILQSLLLLLRYPEIFASKKTNPSYFRNRPLTYETYNFSLSKHHQINKLSVSESSATKWLYKDGCGGSIRGRNRYFALYHRIRKDPGPYTVSIVVVHGRRN